MTDWRQCQRHRTDERSDYHQSRRHPHRPQAVRPFDGDLQRDVETRVTRLDLDLTPEQKAFFVRFIRENVVGTRVEALSNEKIVELGLGLGSYNVGLVPPPLQRLRDYAGASSRNRSPSTTKRACSATGF